MQLRIVDTTDKQHLGHVFEYDVESPPTSIELPDGDMFYIMRRKISGGYYKLFGFNYLIWAVEVG